MCFGGHMNRLEFIHRSHPSEFQGIVFVSLAFYVCEIDFVFLENSREVVAIRCCVEEGVFSSFCVEEVAHGIELTEVKSENFHVSGSMGLGLEFCDVSAS
jgi:hypothetical protein